LFSCIELLWDLGHILSIHSECFKMLISQNELKKFEFHLTHECKNDDNNKVKFHRASEAHNTTFHSNDPMVYLWVVPKDDDMFDVLYVGKAGFGINRRLRQHQSGFVSSGTGRKNLQYIYSVLADTNNKIYVYARRSKFSRLFSVTMNMYSLEEEVFIEKFNPLLNRAQRIDKKFSIAKEKNKSLEQYAVESELNADPVTNFEQDFILGNWDFSYTARVGYLKEFYSEIDRASQEKFIKIINLAFKMFNSGEIETKIVLKYSNQPKGYSGIPTLLFSEIGKKGKALKNKWILRVPFRSDDKHPLTVVLPLSRINPNLDLNRISIGTDKNFCPINLSEFLHDPKQFLLY